MFRLEYFTAALLLLIQFGQYNSFAADRMIVKLKPRALSTQRAREFTDARSAIQARASKRLMGGKLLVVTADPSEFRNNPAVEWAEPDFKVHAYFGKKPADTYDKRAWGIAKTEAYKAWAEGIDGKGVVVAVIDTGVYLNHKALAGRVAVNEQEIRGNGKDDDGNGFVDDVTGWNFVGNNADPNDDNGHGTHCAGTIAGELIGVAPGAKILPVKFLDADGSGYTSDAVEAIHYAVKRGVQVMSNSWGGGEKSKALFEAIDEARQAGIWFVAAAGNEQTDNDSTPSYPASFDLPNVISVAATDSSDKLADFSNWGTLTVHVSAPGVNIYSSVLNNRFDTFSGTSMATPHVSATAALMIQHGITDIREKLIASSDAVAGLPVAAKGRLNAYSAVH